MAAHEENVESTLEKLPIMSLSHQRYLLTVPHYPKKDEVKKQLLDVVYSKNMVPFHDELVAQFGWDVDRKWVEEATKVNKAKIEELDAKITEAVDKFGETEVREANLAKAEFLISIGDKAGAETQFRVTAEKTVALGQRIDIVLALTRIGFFYNDKDLVHRNVAKGKSLIDEGGDWDRRNRLKIYEAYYLMSCRDFTGATKLFIDSLASFSAEELFDYKQNIYYTVLCSLVTLDRVTLKTKIVDSPEVLTVLGSLPSIALALNSFYDTDYKSFFAGLAQVTEEMKEDPALAPHMSFFSREMRIRAYSQFLESYRAVQIKSMATTFGVSVQFIDKELYRFISLGRLNCKIDAVSGIIETVRTDSKNSQYTATIKQGDVLLNRVQKLSRVIHL